MTARLLGAASFAVLCIILTLGLWPFYAPRNDVKWISGADGLRFGRSGTVLSQGPFGGITPGDPARCTIEAWINPEPWHSFSFLSFFDREQAVQLSLGESLVDFELSVERESEGRRVTPAKLYVDDAMHGRKLVFLAVTSGVRGTEIYVNGVLARAAPRFRIPAAALEGQLIVGDAALHPDSFRGEMRGIAIYDRELAEADILRHYQTWKAAGRPQIKDDERIAALYLFHERGGPVVRDEVRPGLDLVIPEQYTVVDKVALEPVWKEFEWTRNYGSAAVKNIVGFVPLGACFYLFLLASRWRRPALATLIAGLLVSLTIEVLQIYLPTRDSGTTDLITNTFGTWLGVIACRLAGPSRLLDLLERYGISPVKQLLAR